MTLFIRNSQNENIISVDILDSGKKVERTATINVVNYSKELIKNLDNDEFINDLDKVNKLHGYYCEYEKKGNHFNTVYNSSKEVMITIAEKYNLDYTVD